MASNLSFYDMLQKGRVLIFFLSYKEAIRPGTGNPSTAAERTLEKQAANAKCQSPLCFVDLAVSQSQSCQIGALLLLYLNTCQSSVARHVNPPYE